MKYSILGFNQQRVLSVRKKEMIGNGRTRVYSLDVVDLLILRDIADFMNRKNIVKYTIKDKTFFTISYSAIIDDLPILNIKKQALRDRLDKLCKLELVEKTLVKSPMGSWPAFRLSDGYEDIMYTKNDNVLFDDIKSDGVVSGDIKEPEKQKVAKASKDVKHINYDGIFDAWNKYNGKMFGVVSKRTTRRKDKIRIALTNQQITDAELMLFFSTLPYADKWLYTPTDGHRNWKPDFDWWIADTKGWLARGLEGKVHKENPQIFEEIMRQKSITHVMEYVPHGRGIYFDKDKSMYMSVEPFYGDVYDGYTNDERPDGAKLMLNNGRGVITWSGENKSWEKI